MRSVGAAAAIFSSLVLVTGCKPSAANVEYETLEPGVRVLRLWEIAEPESPQIAVLQLSDLTHEGFHRDPAAFMNARTIFQQPLRVGGECLQATEGFRLQAIGLQALGPEGSSAGQSGMPFWISIVVRDPDGFFI